MGMRDDNYIIQLHRQGSWPSFTREIRHHHGESGTDVTMLIPVGGWSDLVTAAQTSDAAVFDALQALPGSRDLLIDVQQGGIRIIRQLILDLAGH